MPSAERVISLGRWRATGFCAVPAGVRKGPSLALALLRTASATKLSPVALSRFLADYDPCRLAAEAQGFRGARVLED
jgi:hypothetical protein